MLLIMLRSLHIGRMNLQKLLFSNLFYLTSSRMRNKRKSRAPTTDSTTCIKESVL
jgi:hypothetical protein